MGKTIHVLSLRKARIARQYVSVSIRVTGCRSFKFRTWMAIRLMKIASRILPGDNHVEISS